MEPRISGEKADIIIRKFGLAGAVRVEAVGFSGGIWCCWKQARLAIIVVSTSKYCIHLKVNPNSVNPWYLSVVYASPHASHREELWDELRRIGSSLTEPWAAAGDFNMVLYEFEKDGGLCLPTFLSGF